MSLHKVSLEQYLKVSLCEVSSWQFLKVSLCKVSLCKVPQSVITAVSKSVSKRMHILPLWNPNNKWHFEVSLRTHPFWKVSLGLKSLKVSFSVMWPQYQPIGILEILKLCEISWDLLKKYFHLKSNAVYNSSAKKPHQ